MSSNQFKKGDTVWVHWNDGKFVEGVYDKSVPETGRHWVSVRGRDFCFDCVRATEADAVLAEAERLRDIAHEATAAANEATMACNAMFHRHYLMVQEQNKKEKL